MVTQQEVCRAVKSLHGCHLILGSCWGFTHAFDLIWFTLIWFNHIYMLWIHKSTMDLYVAPQFFYHMYCIIWHREQSFLNLHLEKWKGMTKIILHHYLPLGHSLTDQRLRKFSSAFQLVDCETCLLCLGSGHLIFIGGAEDLAEKKFASDILLKKSLFLTSAL